MSEPLDPRVWNQLGILNDQVNQTRRELAEHRDQMADAAKKLQTAIGRAEANDDEDAVRMLQDQLDDVQDAWVQANDALGDSQTLDKPHTPQPQEEQDDPDVQQDEPAVKPKDVADVPQEEDHVSDED